MDDPIEDHHLTLSDDADALESQNANNATGLSPHLSISQSPMSTSLIAIPIERNHNDPQDEEEHRVWREESAFAFKYLVMLSLFQVCIEGVLPCVLESVSYSFSMNTSQVGLMGGAFYLFSAIGAPISSVVLTMCGKYVKEAFLISQGIAIALTVLFTVLPGSVGWAAPVLLMAFLGLMNSFVCVAGFVWLNVFSNPEQRSSWTGIWQASLLLGTVLGYLLTLIVTSILPQNSDNRLVSAVGVFSDYQLSLSIVCLFMIISAICVMCIKREHLDTNRAVKILQASRSTPHVETSDSLMRRQLWSDFRSIMCNAPFVTSVLMVTFLMFVARGINFWATDYLGKQFVDRSPTEIRGTFVSVALSAPLLGIFVGSWIGNKISKNYDGNEEQNFRRGFAASIAGLIGVIFSVPAAASMDYTFIVFSVWMILFFGAAVLPLGAVIVLEVLEPSQRTVGTGVLNMSSGILGQTTAVVIVGCLSQVSLRGAWSALMSGCAICFFFGLIMVCNLHERKRHAEQEAVLLGGYRNDRESR